MFSANYCKLQIIVIKEHLNYAWKSFSIFQDNKLEGHFNKVFEYEDTENLDKDRKMEKSNKHEDVLTPHPLFVEMDELDGAKWEEKAR